MENIARNNVVFDVKEKNWPRWKGSISVDENTNEFVFHINGQKFEDLPLWPALVKAVVLCRSTAENNWNGPIKKSIYYLILGPETIKIEVTHNVKSRLTKIMVEDDEKPQSTVKGKKLKEAFPITFWYEPRAWKIQIDVNEEESKAF